MDINSILLTKTDNILLDVLFSIIKVSILAFFLFLILRMGLAFKRWYYKAKIKRNGHDFKESLIFIKENNNPLNKFQRLFLDKLGFVVTLKGTLIVFLIGISVGIGLYSVVYILKNNKAGNTVFLIIIWVLSIIGALIMYIISIEATHELVELGRLFGFIICVLAFWAYGITAVILYYEFDIEKIIKNLTQ